MKTVPKEGQRIEYQGKEYISHRELCRELDIPLSPFSHKFYRTQDVEESIAWARETAEKSRKLFLWGKQYQSLTEIAQTFGLNASCLCTRYRATKELEETVKELLEKETIFYKGIEYSGLTELAVTHGFDVTMVWDRLKYGFTLDRALTQPIRELNRPELEVEYQGERYPNKSCLLRCFGISSSCIYEMMGNHGVDFETAVDVYRETKERAGIPQEKLISYLPVCILNGKSYKTVVEVAKEVKISEGAISTYKFRNGYSGILETLQSMKKETIEGFEIGGERITYSQLMKMGYTSSNYKQVPKKLFPRYPTLQEIDLKTDCVDVMKIYEEVKAEFISGEQNMQMNMNM